MQAGGFNDEVRLSNQWVVTRKEDAMDRTHSHIDLDERRKIARSRRAGVGVEIIAEKLGRHFRLFACLPRCYGNLNGARIREATRGVMHRRKEIAELVVVRWKAHGFALDADPQYTLLVELWVDGAIEAREMRRRYLTVLREQESARTSRSARATGVNPQLMECNGFANGPERSQATDTRPSPNLPSSLPD
jgi:hypothetical protein